MRLRRQARVASHVSWSDQLYPLVSDLTSTLPSNSIIDQETGNGAWEEAVTWQVIAQGYMLRFPQGSRLQAGLAQHVRLFRHQDRWASQAVDGNPPIRLTGNLCQASNDGCLTQPIIPPKLHRAIEPFLLVKHIFPL